MTIYTILPQKKRQKSGLSVEARKSLTIGWNGGILAMIIKDEQTEDVEIHPFFILDV
jgi:hypothetical protein